jgi:hypothetical protein
MWSTSPWAKKSLLDHFSLVELEEALYPRAHFIPSGTRDELHLRHQATHTPAGAAGWHVVLVFVGGMSGSSRALRRSHACRELGEAG